jgi:hypothetical protein
MRGRLLDATSGAVMTDFGRDAADWVRRKSRHSAPRAGSSRAARRSWSHCRPLMVPRAGNNSSFSSFRQCLRRLHLRPRASRRFTCYCAPRGSVPHVGRMLHGRRARPLFDTSVPYPHLSAKLMFSTVPCQRAATCANCVHAPDLAADVNRELHQFRTAAPWDGS